MSSDITIRELAKKCGTSVATVSRVFNGNFNPDLSSHQKVISMIEETGYKRRKRVSTTKNILCVSEKIPQEQSHGFLIEKNLELHSFAYNFSLLISHANDPAHIERLIAEHNIKGIVFHTLPKARPSVPAVIINQDHSPGEYSSVTCDIFAGLVEAFKYLKEAGHNRIAYFSDKEKSIFETNPRRSNIPWVYQEAGVEFDEELVYYCSFPHEKHLPHIEKCVRKLTTLPAPPTAIVLCGDCYVSDFYNSFKNNKINIPEDISVIGFDDIPLSENVPPSLTTVRKPFESMIKESLRLLNESLKGNSMKQKILIMPELITRKSVKNKRKL